MSFQQHIETDGFSRVKGLVDETRLDSLRAAELTQGRDLLALPVMERIRALTSVYAAVQSVVGEDARLVRGLFFDKTPGRNWPVRWHQDLTIAVQAKEELPEYHSWTEKEGVPHVQPPARIMASLLTARIHLDDAGVDNGALWVVPGSHRRGRIPEAEIHGDEGICCPAQAGDVFFMRPLLLHASRRSTRPSHRRVIHLEFTAGLLDPPLRWAFGQA
ncbi:MAG: ectoine hydroxylase-related dioxygenase (phytanoyl-CoA dioxygenase family) [Kiritimatiellia bacterium]|jgi:ectoine hydroxylase-related dioxygenase (phytanoyl-CoA dioxygenase family)